MAKAQQMAQARLGQTPKNDGSPQNSAQGNDQGNNPPEAAFNLADLPDLKSMSLGDWAKLPPKVAEELLESQREGLSPEFRKQIHHYFRIIGERGRAREAVPEKK